MDLEKMEYWKSLINMSLTKFLILQTLHQEPCHGYAILERLERFTKGCCAPTYGGIYPVLKELIQGDYARARAETVGGRARRVYELTEKGKNAYQTATEAWQEVLPVLVKIVGESNA
jgi:PadR family transcriptional regulator, regulatory protein PadR